MQAEQPSTSQPSSSTEDAVRIPPRIMLSMCAGPCNGQVLTTDYKKGFCITVGRTKASRLHIRDSAVSERHAEVCWTGTEWLLKDVGSSNGTVYNGRKLQPYVDAVPLNNGDEILFGTDSLGKVQLTPVDCSAFTLEQLLLLQHEVVAQNIEAQARTEARAMLTEWGAVRAELQAA